MTDSIRNNGLTLGKLHHGQFNFFGQVNACFRTLARMQGLFANFTVNQNVSSGAVMSADDSASDYDDLRTCLADNSSKGAPVGFSTESHVAHENGAIKCQGRTAMAIDAAGAWPAVGELAYVSDLTAGFVSVDPGTYGSILGIFLEQPYVLFMPHDTHPF
jgi:hypothetical protein